MYKYFNVHVVRHLLHFAVLLVRSFRSLISYTANFWVLRGISSVKVMNVRLINRKYLFLVTKQNFDQACWDILAVYSSSLIRNLKLQTRKTTKCNRCLTDLKVEILIYQKVPAARVLPRCANAHNCLGPTWGGDETERLVLKLYARNWCGSGLTGFLQL